MSMIVLVFFLVLNFGISFYNAYAAGAYWTETKIIGGWPRFITWCALIMSACGFTWVYLTLLTIGAIAGKWLTPEQGEIMFKLGYLIIILPILGSGFGLWINSLVVAYRQRNFGNIATAGWNTFAQAHNTWNAARHAPNYLKEVISALSPKKANKDSLPAFLIIALVILALFGGIITTGLIARWADRKIALEITSSR